MKRYLLLIPVVLMFFLTGSDYIPYPSSEYIPVFMKRTDMEAAIKIEAPRKMENPGKIYFKDDFIFINEKYRGIHVIDNTNPENPQKKVFIHIDGCIDMAMKGDVLYADNAVDLVAIKLSPDFTQISRIERERKVFPELRSPEGWYVSWRIEQMRPENSIIVRWDKKTENNQS